MLSSMCRSQKEVEDINIPSIWVVITSGGELHRIAYELIDGYLNEIGCGGET